MKELKFTITCEKCGKKLKIIEDTISGDITYEGDNRENDGIWLFGMDQSEYQIAFKNGTLEEYISLDIYCECGNRVDDLDINDYNN